MEQPLLIYKDGRFTRATEVPAWYDELETAWTNAEADGLDFGSALRKVGFECAEAITDENENHHVLVYRCGDVFYAMCSDVDSQLWHATFGWEDWPPFLGKYVIPPISEACLWNLRFEFNEYLARNDPGSHQARERRDEAERMRRRRETQ